MMSDPLLEQAILLAKQHPYDFSFSLLQRRLHVGTVKANLLISKLAERKIVRINRSPSYHITVME